MSDETREVPEPESPDADPADDAAAVSPRQLDGDVIDLGSAGPPGDGDDDSISVEELIETIETVTAERDAHLADLQRLTADFANFRKQSEKRQSEFVAHAAARLAEELLPVLDAFDAAVQQGVEGIGSVRDQLLAVLEKEGLEVLATEGEPFDPHRHEAAMSEPGDGAEDEPMVTQVLRTGYGWNGRVLRAAMVAVKG